MLIKLNPIATAERRESLGLSRDELATKAGVSRVTLYKVENGLLKLGCQAGVAKAIAHALEVDLEQIASPPVRQRRPDLERP